MSAVVTDQWLVVSGQGLGISGQWSVVSIQWIMCTARLRKTLDLWCPVCGLTDGELIDKDQKDTGRIPDVADLRIADHLRLRHAGVESSGLDHGL
jgi:hypothetical protein